MKTEHHEEPVFIYNGRSLCSRRQPSEQGLRYAQQIAAKAEALNVSRIVLLGLGAGYVWQALREQKKLNVIVFESESEVLEWNRKTWGPAIAVGVASRQDDVWSWLTHKDGLAQYLVFRDVGSLHDASLDLAKFEADLLLRDRNASAAGKKFYPLWWNIDMTAMGCEPLGVLDWISDHATDGAKNTNHAVRKLDSNQADSSQEALNSHNAASTQADLARRLCRELIK